MNITPEELDYIERYLLRQLSPEETVQFGRRLNNDSDWKEKVREVQLMMTGIQEAALEQRMKSFHDSMPGQVKTLPMAGKLRWRTMLTAAAVLSVVVLSVWLLSRPSRNERLYSAYFKPDPGLPTAMNATGDYAFNKAMVDYKTGNYDKAIEGWRSLQIVRPSSDTLNYFTACALLARGSESASIPLFDKVISNDKSPFVNDAYWFKGLALLKLGKKQEAIAVIRQSNHEKADELLKSIQ